MKIDIWFLLLFLVAFCLLCLHKWGILKKLLIHMANDIRCTFHTGSHTKNILTGQAELSLKFFVT